MQKVRQIERVILSKKERRAHLAPFGPDFRENGKFAQNVGSFTF